MLTVVGEKQGEERGRKKKERTEKERRGAEIGRKEGIEREKRRKKRREKKIACPIRRVPPPRETAR